MSATRLELALYAAVAGDALAYNSRYLVWHVLEWLPKSISLSVSIYPRVRPDRISKDDFWRRIRHKRYINYFNLQNA